MFNKILIANRGEIACRIARTARRLGIRTVAVYSEADANALHVRLADEALLLGPAPSVQSYLAIDKIVHAARESGAEAVHPGFGFLAENVDFAEALTAEGITFIGPGPRAIAAMGDKIASKKLAIEADVNTVPGHAEVLRDAGHAADVARRIGFPVMLKASAGGGGKGMRIARSENEARTGFTAAASEARSSFADDRVFVEKFIEQPRHIEIQVLADSHGNIVHLGERECSIQRRHQKVVEEAPSPFIDAATRAAMGEQAVRLARAVDYRSAGTVEFIVDAQRNFYFLEMNTRIQVEHPVTEYITGLDLVELMIRIAAGEQLPFAQDDISLNGWAIETRVYAEDPDRDFLPSGGRLVSYRPPQEDEHLRIDTGVYEGGEVSMFYDPMIAKVITGGVTRDEAIVRMRAALDGFRIRGVAHNISFLAAVMHHPRFVRGDLSTAFIDEEYPDGFAAATVPHDDPGLLVAVGALIHRSQEERNLRISGQLDGCPTPGADYTALVGDTEHRLSISAASGQTEVSVDGRRYLIESEWQPGDGFFRGIAGGEQLCIQVDPVGLGWRLIHRGRAAMIRVLGNRAAELNRLMPHKRPPDLSRYLLSPMPGLLVRVAVQAGERVKAGLELAVVEAMKMENVLCADYDGVVAAVLAEAGDSLEVDQPILEFAPESVPESAQEPVEESPPESK